MYCGNCNNILPEGATTCPHCGVPIAQIPEQVVNTNQVDVNGQKSKKAKKIIIFIIGAILLLTLGCGIGYFIGHKNNSKCITEPKELSNKQNDEIKEEGEEKKEEKQDNNLWTSKNHPNIDVSKIKYVAEDDYSKEIEILNYFYNANDNSLIIYGTNKGKENLDYTMYLNYLDANGKRIDRTLNMGYVEAGKKFVVSLNNATNDEVSSISSVSVSCKASKYKSYYHSVKVDEKKLVVSEKESSISAMYKNDLQVEHAIYAGIVYYKDGKIVWASNSYANVKPSLSSTLDFYFYQLPGYEYGKSKASDFFDKYEIFISSGFYYDSEY